MRGVDSTTGRELSGENHLRQSIRDILTTPIGSRVMRRDYGSELSNLVDAPANRATIMDIIAATVDALRKWEPRIIPQRVQVESYAPGSLTIALTAISVPDGNIIDLKSLVIS
jgi:phage baseplate assembly protein W